MRVVAFVAVIALVAALAHAYVIKPQAIAVVARQESSKSPYLWKPTRAVKLADGVGAVRLSTSHDACDGATCTYAVAWTDDDGQSFSVSYEHPDFCGAAGVVQDSGRLVCVGQQRGVDAETGAASFAQVAFEVTGGALRRMALDEAATFEAPAGVVPTDFAGITRFADNVVHMAERGLWLRTAEALLTNGTALHVVYKSADGGAKWAFVGTAPFALGAESALHKLGETKVLLLSGSPGNYTQATSVFLGSRWEKIENVTFATPLSAFVSPYLTTVYGGVRGRPGVTAMAAGPKKGSEKPIDITDMHNRLAHKFSDLGLTNFSAAYRTTTAFDCGNGASDAADAKGCASSSYVSLLSLRNGTVTAFYDKLDGGFAPNGGSTVLALHLALNETKEEQEAQARAEEARKEAEREVAREEARKRAQKETEQRKRRERREKLRKDRERRAAFAAADAPNVESAALAAARDKELIIVREVHSDTVDLEKDTFFF